MGGPVSQEIEKTGLRGEHAARVTAPGLHQNLAADSPSDLRIYGTSARLHGGHLRTPAPDHGVLVDETAEGDVWLQVAYRQKSGENLDTAAFCAYRDLLLRARETNASLVRIWNHIPTILASEDSVIRYHRFNAGRIKAWRKYGPKGEDGQLILPAATGIGSEEKTLFLRAFLSPHLVLRLQNPSQIPPAKYSHRYGALPPIFSRASILLKPRRHLMFVSGTASITGEDTTDQGDPISQTSHSLKNIRNLIDGKNCRSHGYDGHFEFSELKSMRVYVKHPNQFQAIRKVVEAEISCPVTFKHCDICRNELLVEIECIFEKAI